MMSLNTSKTMPFITLGNNEFSSMLRDQIFFNKLESTTRQNLSQKSLFHELPFYKCSDYAIINECKTTKKMFLHDFVHNHFSDISCKILEYLSMDNFSFNYFNEDKFNCMLSELHPIALKHFHLNVRSLNKNCHALKSFLSCLKCKFDIIMLTEIGKADEELAEEVFNEYHIYMDLA